MERFTFGKYNDRALDQKKVSQLQQSMVDNGVQWFNHKNMLPLLVPSASYLDTSSYTKDVTRGPRLPELKLSAEGTKEYPSFVWASGQHRIHAVVKLRKTREEAIAKLREQQQSEGMIVENTESEIEALLTQVRSTMFWGVAIYDESK